MNLYRVFPEPREMHPLDSPQTREVLDQWYETEGSSSLRLSLISSPSGRLVGPDGTSTSLSNPVDRAILLAQRRHADAVVCGANTVRAEPVPVPSTAALVVITSTGNLQGHLISEQSLRPGGVIIISGSKPETDPSQFFPEGVATHLKAGHGASLRASDIVTALESKSLRHLLLEGGKTLAELFAQEQLLDEVCMSLTGPPLSENHPPLPWWQPQWGEWSAQHVLTDDAKTLYFRYRRIS